MAGPWPSRGWRGRRNEGNKMKTDRKEIRRKFFFEIAGRRLVAEM